MTDQSLLKPDNRVIMISGASRGIGAAIAKRLAADGYRLSLGIRSPEKMDEVLKGIQQNRVLCCPFEAKNPQTAIRWAEETSRTYGQIDALINNAGILRQVDFETGSEEDLDEMWEVNVKAPFRLIRLCLPFLKKSKNGRIINIASTDGKRYRESVSVGYTMSKHALVAISDAARFAGWSDGVRVTALCPGAVNTDLIAGIPGVTPVSERIPPGVLAAVVSMLLTLPDMASVSGMPINTRLESSL
ncbi:MAG: SDR family NAD(P)-dependent oxidoreductase [Gammaproteobacteria bacterium]|jgi:NAD(P)-dependent dehydrogenase (short-subunit alcohol dehydrogenase family)|nr:SDR family NAD(P)-dependent oxidoreductase [Gammaproteobacteria bacterium]MDP6397437.1 SDR family NAD(P)-dependent oxidoreductase [Arenicellales bacterium]MDP7516257.1 SDR family NAD(P)-dependent oxidoreductase [Arenicellales bacterium]HCY13045.1 short-chain dehydrogenase [Gammaproteobacteria bacterium]|tara:strand:- start:3912 stop:4646 length:735 start_codon:yes stop_codon:yes gene_type:complete